MNMNGLLAKIGTITMKKAFFSVLVTQCDLVVSFSSDIFEES